MAFNSGASSGNLVLLSSQLASGASIIEFKSVITTAFDDYVLRCSNVTGAGGANVAQFQYSTNNGVSYLSAANYNRTGLFSNSAGGGFYFTGGQTAGYVVPEIDTSGTQQCISIVNFMNITAGTVNPCLFGQSMMGPATRMDNWAYEYAGAIAVNALKVYPDAGTFSGTFKLYGVQK